MCLYVLLQPLGVFDLRHLRHALIYTVLDGMVGKL